MEAEHAAQGLAVAAHYDSCTSGVGRKERTADTVTEHR